MGEQTLAELRAEIWAKLPSAIEVDAARAGKPITKGKTRLQETIEARPLTKVDEKAFKASVWHRDRKRCRCCGRKVVQVMGRVPERGEVYHIHGRGGDLRFEPNTAILLCLLDHERVTGRLNEKWVIEPTKTLTIRGQVYTDARHTVKFVRVA